MPQHIGETVEAEVKRLGQWLTDCVNGLQIQRDDLYSYTLQIEHALLGLLPCGCGRGACPGQHRLAAQPEAASHLRRIVQHAVAGSGVLRASSIAQGMLFPHLQKEYSLVKAMVEFKRCHACSKMYEGTVCPYSECRCPFDPTQTEVIKREWLVIRGFYLPVRRWGCHYRPKGRQTDRSHYYEPLRCGERMAVDTEGYRVVHGDVHDTCPWKPCPNYGRRHSQRGTTLWVQANSLEGVGANWPRRHREEITNDHLH